MYEEGELTNHEIWVELMRYGHNYLLKSIHVISITTTFVQPGNIDVSKKCQLRYSEKLLCNLLSLAWSFANLVSSSIITARIERAVHVNMY
jgi:hypothetical protein